MRRRTAVLTDDEDDIEHEGLDAEAAELERTAAVRSKPRRVDRKRLARWASWLQARGADLAA